MSAMVSGGQIPYIHVINVAAAVTTQATLCCSIGAYSHFNDFIFR